jgi:hypothetical protein
MKASKRKRLFSTCIFVTVFVPLCVSALAQEDDLKVPAEVKPFIEKGFVANALEAADLNGDGTKDYVLVVNKPRDEKAQYDDIGDEPRQTLILVSDSAGKLSLAARNDRVAFCRGCGGVFGDPFAGITAKPGRFTVMNYGGSNDRWSDEYTFAYSKRDRTWQLVRAEESIFRATDPNRTMRTHIRTPPKDFGLINFTDFDPENYRRKGQK